MIIDKNIQRYSIYLENDIREAIQKITSGRTEIIFGVDEKGIVRGLLTNGDILRWLSAQQVARLDNPVSTILKGEFLFANTDDKPSKIEALLEKILYVPIIDPLGRLTAVARRRKNEEIVEIGSFTIGQGHSTFIIAEIGINHNGSLELGKKLIDEAVRAGADCAKFQMRDLASLYRNSGNANDPKEDLGAQYALDLLTRFHLPPETMFQLFDYCKERGIFPLCTAWDVKSVKQLESYGMQAYKVASADLTHHELLKAVAETGKPLIASTGMSTEQEISDSVRLLKNLGCTFVLLHCNSAYPAPFKDINLNYIKRLREIGECPVGYSGHERGIHVAIAAVALGAKVVEKHFTLDKTMEGSDHKISLLPEEFRLMVQGIREVEQALGGSKERSLTQGELINRISLAKSLIDLDR